MQELCHQPYVELRIGTETRHALAIVRAVAKVFRTALQAKREIPRITTTFCVIQEVDCLAEYYATFFNCDLR